jgi:hypothetical protein
MAVPHNEGIHCKAYEGNISKWLSLGPSCILSTSYYNSRIYWSLTIYMVHGVEPIQVFPSTSPCPPSALSAIMPVPALRFLSRVWLSAMPLAKIYLEDGEGVEEGLGNGVLVVVVHSKAQPARNEQLGYTLCPCVGFPGPCTQL